MFLYTNNKLSERETKKKPIYNGIKKYLGISLTREAKDLYIENYKIHMKEILKDTNKWKESVLMGGKS